MKSVACLILTGGAVTLSATVASHTELKPDEQLLFYPTMAHRRPAGEWQMEIRGCIYEPEKRRLTLAALREALELKDVELSPAEANVFNERARLFLADHERNKRVLVRLGGRVFDAGKSKADGTFRGRLRLPAAEVDLWQKTDGRGQGRIGYTAALPSLDPRAFAGELLLMADAGLSVISDIDDTIKITEVRDRRATLRNTFLREFRPVPGMAAFYQRLAGSNPVSFHYVSASPWQLYPPLAEFVKAHGFPAGTFHLKEFRWKDERFLSLFANPENYKTGVIEPLLKQFPHRRFVLIGDSGERDPEIYAGLARKHPRQIEHIFIRDVTGEAAEAPRYRECFRTLPREVWTVFHEPPSPPP